MDSKDMYKRQNEQWSDPLEGRLEKYIAEIRQYYPSFELERDLWWHMYALDGVTEFVAEDIVKALIWKHLQLKIHQYQMLVENLSGDVALESFRNYNWNTQRMFGGKEHAGWTSTAVPSDDDWNNNTLDVLHSFDRAVQTLALIDLRLELRSVVHEKPLDALLYWEASVMGVKAKGNSPTHAAVRAWGAYVGLWDANDERVRVYLGISTRKDANGGQ